MRFKVANPYRGYHARFVLLKSSEFTIIRHVWPCLCGQKGAFLKVLAKRHS